METVVNIPYHIYNSKRGRLGIDAYTWGVLRIPYAHALLIRPADVLRETPYTKGRTLPVKVEPIEQVRGLSELQLLTKKSIMDKTVKYYKWRILRFFMIPLPSRTSGLDEISDAVYADKVIGSILPIEPLGRIGYYTLTIRVEGRRITFNDKRYGWLWWNDDGFRILFRDLLVREPRGVEGNRQPGARH